MDKYIVIATVTFIGVIISNIVIYSNQRKVLKDNRAGRDEVRTLSKEIKTLEANQAEKLAKINKDLNDLSYVFEANYSKSREVLSDFYSRISEIRVLLESYVVPLFDYSETKKIETIVDASKKFEKLYMYIETNRIHINDSKYYMYELSELMSFINRMKNIASDKNLGSTEDQIENIQTGINPIVRRIEKRIKKDLKIVD